MRSSRRLVGLTVALLAAVAGCSGWHGVAITSYRSDGDRLVVNGHCNDDGRVRVTEEDAGKVVLRLEVEGSRKGDCLDCPTIELVEPLAERKVFDAHNGETVALDPETC
jgi:hypothetical protein